MSPPTTCPTVGQSKAISPSSRGVNIHEARRANNLRLKSRLELIYQKYGRDFGNIGDEINLRTGQIVVDNGHLNQMENEQDIGGCFSNNLHPHGKTHREKDITEPVTRFTETITSLQPTKSRQPMKMHLPELGCRCRHSQPALANADQGPDQLLDGSILKVSADSNPGEYEDYCILTGSRSPTALAPAVVGEPFSAGFPKLEQPRSEQIESVWAAPKRLPRGRQRTGWADRNARALLAPQPGPDSDSDDPLQENSSKARTVSRRPCISKYTHMRLSTNRGYGGAQLPQKKGSEFHYNVLLCENQQISAKQHRSNARTTFDPISKVITMDSEFNQESEESKRPLLQERPKVGPLTAEEINYLLDLRMVKRRSWPEVLSAMPWRSARLLKHWYSKHCIEVKNIRPLDIRDWVSQQKERPPSVQQVSPFSLESVQPYDVSVDRVQGKCNQGSGERQSGTIKFRDPSVEQAITKEVRMDEDDNLRSPVHLLRYTQVKSSARAATNMIKSESPDPLVDTS
ncbi:hypothetical protein D8B26_003675 [Coccidioides posadasii str. Silveira]|uniref:Uncharacterized protein n=2 Tax=Coccidioides posadasii TaxID=199306 RepID=E9DIL8_COCPS|nr:conserved hypothetical protein [Coccidioides posadasii str. Silveira]KMM69780.1 hypothetical protein CPAG_06094 [Coccidioides posadasii RMSCC 3488]QVM09006.1 hypothetical protein D8B26_003675 [Coccidioides posadasii str. Silveira]